MLQRNTTHDQIQETCHIIKCYVRTWACVHSCEWIWELWHHDKVLCKDQHQELRVFSPLFISWLCQLDCLRRSRSFMAPFLQPASEGSSPKRPTELVNAMITSNSGCDLRPPEDTYAFKCEAKHSSLKVTLTTSCCAACAFIQGNLDLLLRDFGFVIGLVHTQISSLCLQYCKCCK